MESASQSRQADKAKPLISIKDIAKEAGVSICTVSLVLNNKDRNRVSKAVAQRVRETAQSMGYKPNSVARTLRTSRSYVLGFITDEIAITPYAGRVLVGAQEVARKLGYILLTVNTGNDRELENQEIAALRQYRVDGFLYAMMYHRVVEIPAELEGSPTVVVDSEDENRKIPSIYPDDEMAGYDATNRLIQAGCKRIVYYGSSITIIAQGERFAGYRRALADAGIPFDEQLVVNVEEATNAASEAGRVFDEIKPDGIFCFNDVRATFIYEAARERSVGIGTDVSVISIDNQPLITDVLKPALTTLELPHYEMGFEAVHQLVAMIDDEAATESLARSEDSIRRSENGPMTPLRCRIIERDSIVPDGTASLSISIHFPYSFHTCRGVYYVEYLFHLHRNRRLPAARSVHRTLWRGERRRYRCGRQRRCNRGAHHAHRRTQASFLHCGAAEIHRHRGGKRPGCTLRLPFRMR